MTINPNPNSNHNLSSVPEPEAAREVVEPIGYAVLAVGAHLLRVRVGVGVRLRLRIRIRVRDGVGSCGRCWC